MGNNPRAEPRYDLNPSHVALLGIDIQQAFGDGAWEHVPDAPRAVANFIAAATAWRDVGGRVILCREIYHPSDYLGPDGRPVTAIVESHPLMEGRLNAEFYPGLVSPGDIIMRKTGFSAVASGNLLEILAEHGCDTVVLGGLTTPICVGTTSDDLSMAGFKVVILEDACASQSFDGVTAQDAHAFAIARFRYQFGQTLTTAGFTSAVAKLHVSAR